MNKSKLQVGKKYLHIRKNVIDGVEREAERWIKCVGITSEGAYFTRMMEVKEFLNNSTIEEELHES